MNAAQAAGFVHQARLAALGTERTQPSGGGSGRRLTDRLRGQGLSRDEKAGFDHVPFDDVAYRRDQRADITAIARPPRGSNTCFSSSATKATLPPRRKTALIMRVRATTQA